MSAPDASPAGPRGGWLRGLGIGALVLLLGGLAFLGGLLATAAVRLYDRATADSSTTTVRPAAHVITAVRDLVRFETTTFHVERVIDLTEEQKRFYGMVPAQDAILLVAAADVTAGFDLSKLGDDDIEIDGDGRGVTLRLPAPEILSTELDPENTYVHTRKTDILARRREDLESRARAEAVRELRGAAERGGILLRARESGTRSMTALLRALGFERVEITFRD